MVRTLKNWLERPTLWLVGTVIFMAGAAAWRTSDGSSGSPRWPSVLDQGETVPFTVPAQLSNGLVWQQNEAAPGLSYRSFDSSGPVVHIVAYPDVFPQEWQVGPAADDSYHLVWLEQDGRLRNAVINSAGQTVRGPIELAPLVQPGFSVISRNERLLVLWVDGSGHLGITELDEVGRPRPSQHPVPDSISFVAGGLDQVNTLHLAWLISLEADQWAVQYQAAPVDEIDTGTPSTLLTFSLAPTENLFSFSIGLDQEYVYLLWSTTQAEQPDQERIYLWAFPIDEPQNGTLSELLLPPQNPAPLRWVRPITGQQARLILTLAVRTSSGWRPAVAFWGAGRLLDFQIIAQQPANAGPPTAIVDKNGSVRVVWSSLRGAISHLFLTGQGGEERGEDRVSALISGFVRLPLSFLWLLIPVGLIGLSSRLAPLALVLYATAQLIWPCDLFATIPPSLTTIGLDRFQPACAVGSAVLLIGALAGIVWYSLVHDKRLSWQAFFLVDALLIWLIFGANVG